LTFDVYPWRFTFIAAEAIRFPAGKSGNVLRGAFGSIFRRIACVPECPGAAECERRATCGYARIFEPASVGTGPSGLADWPRPFVFRASELDGRTVRPGESFRFDVHVFDTRRPALEYFVRAFAELAKEGLGPQRGRAALTEVTQLDGQRQPAVRVYEGHRVRDTPEPVSLELSPQKDEAQRVVVRFVTPTELKHGDTTAERPEFGILFARARDRVATLRTLYGAGPMEADFRGLGERAAAVRMTRCEVVRRKLERRSSRTGQSHPLGGFLGEAEYEGELREVLPWLRAAEWTGVGRQTVWGKGEIRVFRSRAGMADG
jgi:hypothetical protein